MVEEGGGLNEQLNRGKMLTFYVFHLHDIGFCCCINVQSLCTVGKERHGGNFFNDYRQANH